MMESYGDYKLQRMHATQWSAWKRKSSVKYIMGPINNVKLVGKLYRYQSFKLSAKGWSSSVSIPGLRLVSISWGLSDGRQGGASVGSPHLKAFSGAWTPKKKGSAQLQWKLGITHDHKPSIHREPQWNFLNIDTSHCSWLSFI